MLPEDTIGPGRFKCRAPGCQGDTKWVHLGGEVWRQKQSGFMPSHRTEAGAARISAPQGLGNTLGKKEKGGKVASERLAVENKIRDNNKREHDFVLYIATKLHQPLRREIAESGHGRFINQSTSSRIPLRAVTRPLSAPLLPKKKKKRQKEKKKKINLGGMRVALLVEEARLKHKHVAERLRIQSR